MHYVPLWLAVWPPRHGFWLGGRPQERSLYLEHASRLDNMQAMRKAPLPVAILTGRQPAEPGIEPATTGGEAAPTSEDVPELDPYYPGLAGRGYSGLVWNHPTIADGTEIHTTRIVQEFAGRIETRSGTVYQLGRRFESAMAASCAGLVCFAGSPKALPGRLLRKERGLVSL